jgi:hypothetical protein
MVEKLSRLVGLKPPSVLEKSANGSALGFSRAVVEASKCKKGCEEAEEEVTVVDDESEELEEVEDERERFCALGLDGLDRR